MGKALYRKYRPTSLAEVVGQEHITTTLVTALKSGRISHAYLFSGPRGVGKTSIARILAHEINGFDYTDESAHLDIIEIDAASNRRIDEIRELRDKVYIAPTSGKYKVYIIDEVHMLTREAFNALLKTLEEPPAHAVFILATTEAHKLPDTIISRTQHYTFKPVAKEQVIKHLAAIAKKEKIAIDTPALELLATHGQGSFRDSISLLDQAGSIGSKITLDEARRLLGIAPETAIDQLIATLSTHNNAAALLAQLSELYASGLRAAAIAGQLAARLRNALAAGKPVLPVDLSLRLLRELIEVPASHNPERLLEIVVLEAADNSMAPVATISITPAAASEPITAVEPQKPAAEKKHAPKAAEQKPTEPPDPTRQVEAAQIQEPAAATITIETAPAVSRDLTENVWPEVLNSIKTKYNTLYGVLRMARPIFSDNEVELQFKFAFHQKRLNEVKNRKIIADFIKSVTGRTISVRCTINKEAVPAAAVSTSSATAVPASPPTEVLGSIADIFGGGEVLNS